MNFLTTWVIVNYSRKIWYNSVMTMVQCFSELINWWIIVISAFLPTARLLSIYVSVEEYRTPVTFGLLKVNICTKAPCKFRSGSYLTPKTRRSRREVYDFLLSWFIRVEQPQSGIEVTEFILVDSGVTNIKLYTHNPLNKVFISNIWQKYIINVNSVDTFYNSF